MVWRRPKHVRKWPPGVLRKRGRALNNFVCLSNWPGWKVSEARHLQGVGEAGRAAVRLRAARQRLAKLGARPYLEMCERDLASISPRGSVLVSEGIGLTPAELAVARLVSAGRTNPEAAAELYASVKTVEFRLAHIFGKLNIRSRNELPIRLGRRRSVPRTRAVVGPN